MIKVGLLGAGRIGKVHAKSIAAHPGSKLVAVADINQAAAAELASVSGARAAGVDGIISDPNINAVLIATSTDTHSDLIEAATAAGKAVLCEKPVDLSLERAMACQTVAARNGQPVMIGFNRRFDPNFATLKRALDAGEIGKGEMLAITSFDPAPPPISYVKVSGGLFRDSSIHDFDMACWMFGGTPAEVSAFGSSLVDPAIGAAGDVDTAVTTLRYADGRLVVIRNSRRAVYGHEQRLEVLGSEGMLQVGNVLEHTVTKSTVAGSLSARPELFFLERYMRAYEAEWRAFVQAVEQGNPMPITLQDGVNALLVAEAATLSKELGRPVKLVNGRAVAS
jgi:myo-inositol 2-dehydrogenase/D-chiro-inositol 1-dehydrogenase